MIRLNAKQFRLLERHARRCLPNEACGLLAGTEEDGVRDIKKVYLLTNRDASPSHFSLDPAEQIAAVRDMRALGLQPLGNWHSHPQTPARPSEEDMRLAYDRTATYMILSLQSQTVTTVNAFRIQNNAYQWEILEIYD